MSKNKNKHNIGREEVLTFKEWKESEFETITDFECEGYKATVYSSGGHWNSVTGIWEEDADDDGWGGTRYMC